MTVYEALKYHMTRYREMTPQDAVKLIYQSEFGCGHMISDRDGARRYLTSELADTARDESTPTVEPVGRDSARINLASLPKTLNPDTVFSMFFNSAPLFYGNEARYERKLSLPLQLIEEKIAPFSAYEYSSFLERYFRDGGGAVHHSLRYSSAYRPAYRVVHSSFSSAVDVFARIDEMLANGKRGFCVAIDGRCGSGKTTLASRLYDVYGCGVVHADDYYLPFSERSGQLGNLDAARMRRELSTGGAIVSRAYDPHTDKTVSETAIVTDPFFVLEGSYSSFADTGVKFALRVFVTTDIDEQRRRIAGRCPDRADDFEQVWIPAEEHYFKEFDVENRSDIVVKTN